MSSLPDDMEEVIEVVTKWAVDAIKEIIKALIPDGRPFMKQFQTIEEELKDYLLVKGGGRKAFLQAIRENEEYITTKLQESAVSPEMIKAVHPFNIALVYELSRSSRLELELEKFSLDG